MGPTSCGHRALARAAFRFDRERDATVRCWRCALGYRPLLRRSARIALVVGTLLALINHGDQLVLRRMTTTVALKILFTFLVPFGVATWSALATARVRRPVRDA